MPRSRRPALPLLLTLLLGLAAGPGCRLGGPDAVRDAPGRLPTAPGPWMPGQVDRNEVDPDSAAP